ncbi:uncharacterized protein LOC130077983 [Rhinichthys klamathensis goyatoka]|uniref:uncharacterized protein LOC130077983 n=1 Tax=Rhinichthys klamathensis goyatoka TaxID=3034132 RepID=UPI0024B608C7|nr:uncharacterized protein LOC130077983 [Rhinichthys klamathensis goyatoka]
MVREGDLRNLGLDNVDIKRSQAVSRDYERTGYDRGHLNPSSFSCGDGRTATFTLTNAAPMIWRFNRVHWREREMTLRSFLLNQLKRDGGLATAYIVTGTVPNANVRIPQRENSEDSERVWVPSHIWTAVCYKHHFDDSKSFSFGYITENQPEEPLMNLMRVSDLDYQLSLLYHELVGPRRTVNINIFVDGCFGDNNKLNMVKILMNLPGKQGVQIMDPSSIAFASMNTYNTMAEDLKVFSGRACLITHVKSHRILRDELRKRDVSEWPDAVECLVVPEKQKTAADGSQCSSFSDSVYSCQCTSGGLIMPCCSSPCLYQPYLKSYRCNSGRTQIECSPQSSLITAKGERCRYDHPCATYGYDYYWCKTHGFFKDGWDYCSPPLWSSKAKNGKFCRSDHACARYGLSEPWCYTDTKGSHDQCCTSDDCYSAVNGKTCRSDHKCGDHGYNWDYCCKKCA